VSLDVRDEGRGSQRTVTVTITTLDGITLTVSVAADSDHITVAAHHPTRFAEVHLDPTSGGEGELRVSLGASKPGPSRQHAG
jgi:hypothetical protein